MQTLFDVNGLEEESLCPEQLRRMRRKSGEERKEGWRGGLKWGRGNKQIRQGSEYGLNRWQKGGTPHQIAQVTKKNKQKTK